MLYITLHPVSEQLSNNTNSRAEIAIWDERHSEKKGGREKSVTPT
jgi:hypothetical protein